MSTQTYEVAWPLGRDHYLSSFGHGEAYTPSNPSQSQIERLTGSEIRQQCAALLVGLAEDEWLSTPQVAKRIFGDVSDYAKRRTAVALTDLFQDKFAERRASKRHTEGMQPFEYRRREHVATECARTGELVGRDRLSRAPHRRSISPVAR